MTVTALEYTNGAKSTCDGGLAAGGTTLTVLDGSVFPASGEFLVWVWDWASYPDPNTDAGGEIVLCTSRTGNALTVTRAQEGTADVTHADGERVALYVTAEGLNRLWDAVNETEDLFVGLAPTAGNVVQPTAASVVPLTLRGHASQTANLLEVQSGAETVLLSVDSDGQALVEAAAADAVPLTLKAAASQTAALLEVQSSAGTVLLAVQADGDLVFTDGVNVELGTATGTQFGTTPTALLGLWGATPTVQQATITALNAAYTIGDLDTEAEVIAAVNATNAAVNELIAALQAVGVLA